MLGKGYGDVLIVDLAKDGKVYAPTEFAPTEFAQFYADARK
jgi:hypothetical protein